MFALTFSKLTLRAAIYAAILSAVPLAAMAQDADADDPPPEAGRISYVSGNVSIQPVTADEWGQAYPNLPLGPGDRIFTDSNGRAEIQIGQTYVRIGPNSDVTLVDDSQFNINFGVAQGSIRLHSFSLWPRQLVDISTPNGNAEFGQQGDLRVDVLPNDGATVFTNLGQFADITAAGNFRQELNSGQSLELAGSNPVYPQWLRPAGPDDLDAWAQQRDQRLAQVASFNYVSPDIPGAADLDTYGDWQPQTEYGAVWFPRNVPADWQPYHYGHWINRDPWGWVWVEDEPWGYAPFHYGRWVVYGGRWGWVPGPVHVHPVWSPALVVFAGGANFGGGLSVWFPLGPGEPYRPWYRCSPRYIDQVNITNIREAPRVRVERTYVNVVNVTNITYVNKTYVTAVRRDDFASGRRVRDVAVRVDPREVQHIQPLPRPIVAAPARPIISRPVAHPVPVSINRPVLINQQGKQIEARPGAAPVAPPVRPAPPVKPLPGRTIVAAPAHPAPNRVQQGPNQFPAEQGNQQQQRPGNAPYQPNPTGIPRANPVTPVPGLPRDINSRPGNPPANTNQPSVNPNQPHGQQPVQPSGRPTPPDQQQNRPNQPQYQQPNQQVQQPGQPPRAPNDHDQNRPNQPIQQQQGQPTYQAPRAPNYHDQNRPNQPVQQQPGQPTYQPPQAPNNQDQNRPIQAPQPNQPSHQMPRVPNYQEQSRPNQPQNPPPAQNRQDSAPVQPDRHHDQPPTPPSRQMNQERPVPPPQSRPVPPPQERPTPPPQSRPAPAQQPRPMPPQSQPSHPPQQQGHEQQQPRPHNEGQKPNKDQKQNEKQHD